MPTTKPRVSITVDAEDLAVLDRYAAASGTPRASVIGSLIQAVIPELERAAELIELANAAPQKVVDDVVQNLSNATADAMGFLEPFRSDYRKVMRELGHELDKRNRKQEADAGKARGADERRPTASAPGRRKPPRDPHLLTGGSK